MSVIYNGKKPERNYSIADFYKNGVVVSMFLKWRNYEGHDFIRCIFRSNGLLGEIRTTCYHDTYAVDVQWGWHTNERQCLTTECKNMREAKSILFEWFKSKNFSVPKEATDKDWNKGTLAFNINSVPNVFKPYKSFWLFP